MTLPEIALILGFAMLVAGSTVPFVCRSIDVFRAGAALEVHVRDVAALRAALARTTETADRVRIHGSAPAARLDTDPTETGQFLRLEFSNGDLAPFATVELRGNRLWLRRSDGGEWVMGSGWENLSFSFVDGVIRVTGHCRGIPADLWVATS